MACSCPSTRTRCFLWPLSRLQARKSKSAERKESPCLGPPPCLARHGLEPQLYWTANYSRLDATQAERAQGRETFTVYLSLSASNMALRAAEWHKLPTSLTELCINTTLRCGQSFRYGTDKIVA
jgi:hypothetical protein